MQYKLREEKREDRKAMRYIANQKQNIKLTRLKQTQRICVGGVKKIGYDHSFFLVPYGTEFGTKSHLKFFRYPQGTEKRLTRYSESFGRIVWRIRYWIFKSEKIGTEFWILRNLVLKFQIWENWCRILESENFGTEFWNPRIRYRIFRSEKIGTEFWNLRNSVQNFQIWENWHRISQILKVGTGTDFLKFENSVPSSSDSQIRYQFSQILDSEQTLHNL